MQRLRRCDRIAGRRRKSTRFRRSDAILNSFVRLGAFDLPRAGVDRDHSLEKLRECDGGLPTPGGAIKRQLLVRRIGSDEFEEGPRILRPKLRVLRCLSREMVFEVHLVFFFGFPAATCSTREYISK